MYITYFVGRSDYTMPSLTWEDVQSRLVSQVHSKIADNLIIHLHSVLYSSLYFVLMSSVGYITSIQLQEQP